jgi:VanZ family protein
MAVIFVATSIPNLQELPGGLSDTSYHAAGYAVLGALFVRGFAAARWEGVSPAAVLLAVACAAAYAAFDEWHQRFVPGRFPDVRDFAADAAGAAAAAIGVWACGIIRRFRSADSRG